MVASRPINQSLDTYNAYRVNCRPNKRTQTYKLCLHVIEAFDSGVIGEGFPECQACLKGGTCAARYMRQEEERAGACLFYEESPLKAIHAKQDNPAPAVETRTHNTSSPSYKRGWATLDPKSERPKPVAKKSRRRRQEFPDIEQNEHAQLVAAAVKKDEDAGLRPRSGESMADYVRRLRQEKGRA